MDENGRCGQNIHAGAVADKLEGDLGILSGFIRYYLKSQYLYVFSAVSFSNKSGRRFIN